MDTKAHTQTLILETMDSYIKVLQKHKDMQSLEIVEKLSLIYERVTGHSPHDEETKRKVNTLYEAFGKLNK